MKKNLKLLSILTAFVLLTSFSLSTSKNILISDNIEYSTIINSMKYLNDDEKLIKNPSNWTWTEFPVILNTRMFVARAQGEFNSTLETFVKFELKSHNVSLISPWSEVNLSNLEPDDFYNIKPIIFTIPANQSQGTGEILLNASLEWQGFYTLWNGTTNEFLNYTFIEKITEKHNFTWDISHTSKPITEIDWMFFDYNYWGPNPAWRVHINADRIIFKYLDDRIQRFTTKNLYNELDEAPTNPTLWNQITELTTTMSAFNWIAFGYRSGHFACDGPAHRNTANLTFGTISHIIIDDFDYTDCDSYETWVPQGYHDLREILWNALVEANTTIIKISGSQASENRFPFVNISITSSVIGIMVVVPVALAGGVLLAKIMKRL